MQQVNPAGLAEFAAERDARLNDHFLGGRYFPATITRVDNSAYPPQVQIQRSLETSADGAWYASPNFMPVVGDNVVMVWQEDNLAVVGWQISRSSPAMSLVLPPLLLTADAGSVYFSAIQGYYRHLRIFVVAQTSSATPENLACRFNQDSGTNYYWSYNHSNATTPLHAEFTGQTAGVLGTMSTSASVNWGVNEITIYHYSTTRRTNCEFHGWRSDVGTPLVPFNGGTLWAGGAANPPVTTIQLFPANGNFKANTEFALYGIL